MGTMARKLAVSLEAFTLLLCSSEWSVQIAPALLDFEHSGKSAGIMANGDRMGGLSPTSQASQRILPSECLTPSKPVFLLSLFYCGVLCNHSGMSAFCPDPLSVPTELVFRGLENQIVSFVLLTCKCWTEATVETVWSQVFHEDEFLFLNCTQVARQGQAQGP